MRISKIKQEVVNEITNNGEVITKLQPIKYGFDVESELLGNVLVDLIKIIFSPINKNKKYRIHLKIQELEEEEK